MDGSTCTYTSPSVKNQGIRRICDKRKISVSWKIKIRLATASAGATLYQRCHYVHACCAFFMALFSESRRFGSTSLFSTQCPVVIEEDTRTAVARHRLEIWLWKLLDKCHAGLKLPLPHTGVRNIPCHVSRAEEVMRARDTRHTRSIKTNSTVNLSCKPGLDLCGDLVQRLQGVPRTCSFIVLTSSYVQRFCSSHHSNCL